MSPKRAHRPIRVVLVSRWIAVDYEMRLHIVHYGPAQEQPLGLDSSERRSHGVSPNHTRDFRALACGLPNL